ncbi:uncharacterized protein DUF4419 [Taibaiella chishuiensis]|uniref:Uncharacterized protein DUF4419 n=1 Tax=Taibaiella chishuiensis TaxID=1434707 RepID=A0A2P8CXC8_9BACT|nr:uncharacterized protein DUF4419 [Taibaiella chishuiensis]
MAAKAALLRKYNLDWWIDELAPLLEQFVQASEGKTDRPFWRNMFKYHTRKVYGAPKVIDGWIVKFFPYNNKRQRNDLKSISNADDLPDERVKVDFSLLKVLPDGRTETLPMQFIAGFTSLKQDHKTMRLTPQIGWLVSPPQQNPHLARLKKESRSGSEPIRIRVSEVPEAILALKTIEAIEIEFLDSIRIPEQMATLKIEWMMLSGKITNEEKTRIAMLFPDTYIKINDEAQKNRQYEVIKKREAQEMAELLREIREEQAGATNQTGN